MPNFKVTYRFNFPIRPDITVIVEGENEEDVTDNGHLAAEKKGISFGPYAYNEKPFSIVEVK